MLRRLSPVRVSQLLLTTSALIHYASLYSAVALTVRYALAARWLWFVVSVVLLVGPSLVRASVISKSGIGRSSFAVAFLHADVFISCLKAWRVPKWESFQTGFLLPIVTFVETTLCYAPQAILNTYAALHEGFDAVTVLSLATSLASVAYTLVTYELGDMKHRQVVATSTPMLSVKFLALLSFRLVEASSRCLSVALFFAAFRQSEHGRLWIPCALVFALLDASLVVLSAAWTPRRDPSRRICGSSSAMPLWAYGVYAMAFWESKPSALESHLVGPRQHLATRILETAALVAGTLVLREWQVDTPTMACLVVSGLMTMMAPLVARVYWSNNLPRLFRGVEKSKAVPTPPRRTPVKKFKGVMGELLGSPVFTKIRTRHLQARSPLARGERARTPAAPSPLVLSPLAIRAERLRQAAQQTPARSPRSAVRSPRPTPRALTGAGARFQTPHGRPGGVIGELMGSPAFLRLKRRKSLQARSPLSGQHVRVAVDAAPASPPAVRRALPL